MAAVFPLRPFDPACAKGQVWHADELGEGGDAAQPTGHATLDAQLPGGGWPVGGMTEILQSHGAQHVWRLLLPALAQAVHARAGPVVLVGAPCEPFGPALRAHGLPGERLLCVRTERPEARLWATVQALRCAEVGAVLAWLPQVRGAELRRVQMTAHQHERLLFVMRPERARHEASPARLRLWVQGVDALAVHVLKRRGPPLQDPVMLDAHGPQVQSLLAVRRLGAGMASGPVAIPVPVPVPAPPRILPFIHPNAPHALDRLPAAA